MASRLKPGLVIGLLSFISKHMRKKKNLEKMLKSKVFLKKTKRGGVLKIVREHYLRDDITCGHPSCTKCEIPDDIEEDMDTEIESTDVNKPQRSSNKSSQGSRKSGIVYLADNVTTVFNGVAEKHIIVPDTNVVLHQVGLHT